MKITIQSFLIFSFCICCFNKGITQTSENKKSEIDSVFQHVKFRNIGPFRGGRSVASSGVIGNPQTYYMGSTGGGIWKTVDAGINWENISDGQLKTGSVGAIAVSESDPNVIYVGMGEHPVRGVMTSAGDGVYKSMDAGKTWSHIGLKNARHIAEIRIHPHHPDIVWVAVQGALHGDSKDRGVYKSEDGGESWTKVLFVDHTTGAADLSLDISNPRILYAGMWDHRRYPWQVRSGGPGSGLYKSVDGGTTWDKLSDGLPAEMGKTAIDVSRANPSIVYANIESEGTKGGVYRSNNGGQSWKQTSSDRITVARAWYYIEIFADPIDENTVYVLNAPMLKSIDGGKTFESIRNPHGDQHHMWINPNDASNIILSNDGGACVTFNGGVSWSTQQNQPTIQFYRVITDNVFPYNVYGGQQDNSSIITASRTTGAGITWKDWFNGPGCESAFLAFDPNNPIDIFGGCYQGNISVMDRNTKEETDIMAYPTAGLGWTPSEMKYRFNWNAPIVASPQDPTIIYHGGNKVLVTRDKGQSWTEMSPDLTRNDKAKQIDGGAPYTNEGAGGEVYNTISYIEASQHSADVLWVGSDCGLVHVTADGGQNWSDVTPKGIGEALINTIDVSPHNPSTAYLAVTKYKFNDFSPMIYKTENLGRSWKKLVSGIADEDFVRVVREDLKVHDLLYAGTDNGMYISYNGGENWQKFSLNLPICPITDFTFQDNDLIVATSGRSFWILDDLTSIQEYKSNNSAIKIFKPKPTYRVRGSGRTRPGTVLGQNPLTGLIIDYFIPESLPDSVQGKLEIMDAGGNVLRSYSNKKEEAKSFPGGPPKPKMLPLKQGINRFNWDMRRSTLPGIDHVFLLGGYSGAMVPPGTYKLKLTIGDHVKEVDARLIGDPRISATQDEYDDQYKYLIEAETMAKDLQGAVQKMRQTKKRLGVIIDICESNDAADDLVNLGKSIEEAITKWEVMLIQPDQKTFQDVINFPNKLNAELVDLMGRMSGMDPKISSGMKSRFEDLKEQYNEATAEKDRIINEQFSSFNEKFKAQNIDILTIPKN